MRPALTIVVAVKNQGSRLALTLAALDVQRDFNEAYEVLVIDDGSSEPVRSWTLDPPSLRPYSLRVLETSSSGRRGIPRNRGAREARGDVLVFLDADACPGSRLLRAHWDAHASGRTGILLGDCHVIQATESLENPTQGVRFSGFREELSRGPAPVCFKPEEIRLQGDAALESHGVKGIYPNAVWQHRGVEDMLARGSPFAWAGVIPHNLSMTRATFEAVRGFDETLLHFEGWDLGIRAASASVPLGWVRHAKSFHLYHWRGWDAHRTNAGQAIEALQQRYPEAGIEAFLTWCAAINGNPFVPAELNLSNVRVLEEWFARGGSKAWFQAQNATLQKRAAVDYWYRAVNSPLRVDRRFVDDR